MRRLLVLSLLLACAAPGCRPIKRFAINQVANTLAESSTTFQGDGDPELVREALPFSLKLIEGTLAETPRHRGLLQTACSGFTQYAYAFLLEDADELEARDVAAAKAIRLRAKNLFLRARDYGLRGLEVRHPGLGAALRASPRSAVAVVRRADDAALLYWTGAAWGSAIAVAKDDPDLVADQSIVEALFDRALALDEALEDGAVHSALISYEMVRREAEGRPEDRARRHFERAVELSRGRLAAPYVACAESVSIQLQDRRQFEELLGKALAIDPDAHPASRMNNLINQKRARWLLSRADELFLE